jgi:2-polyprenyl-3-methyl-5-hydroxy-6-metoxy-1,4-benzoquinol methylase
MDRPVGLVKSAAVALLKRWGPASLRVRLWDTEFRRGHWDGIESTADDYLYQHLGRYLRGGSLLDMGCGTGNTATELDPGSYSRYVGTDLSGIAIERARTRSAEHGRSSKNTYHVGDLQSYEPSGRFEVILFRESLYYVPTLKVRSMLDRLADSLSDDGVFVVRMWHRGRHADLVKTITQSYEVLECAPHGSSDAIVLVFRPRQTK